MPSTTFTYTAQNGQRLAAAYGAKLGLKDANGDPRPATEAEIKAVVIAQWKAVVREYERPPLEQAAINAIQYTDIDPT